MNKTTFLINNIIEVVFIKSTGVIRRIDELGRIVIPKELRNSLRIKEGDTLEIYTNDDKIILSRHSQLENIYDIVKQYVKSIYKVTKLDMIVCDTIRVIATCGRVKESIIGCKIDIRLENRLSKKQTQTFDKSDDFEICEQMKIRENVILKPICVYGDVIGGIIIICDNKIDENNMMLIETSASFISTYLEN